MPYEQSWTEIPPSRDTSRRATLQGSGLIGAAQFPQRSGKAAIDVLASLAMPFSKQERALGNRIAGYPNAEFVW
jgi:hypothetical protein